MWLWQSFDPLFIVAGFLTIILLMALADLIARWRTWRKRKLKRF